MMINYTLSSYYENLFQHFIILKQWTTWHFCFTGVHVVKKNIFVLFFRRTHEFITLTLRLIRFKNLRSIGSCTKMCHEKENNFPRTKACGRHAFYFLRPLSMRKKMFLIFIENYKILTLFFRGIHFSSLRSIG